MDVGLFLALALLRLPAVNKQPTMQNIKQQTIVGTAAITAIMSSANCRLDSVSTVSRKAGSC